MSEQPLGELLFALITDLARGNDVPGGRQAIIQTSFAAKGIEGGTDILITALAVALRRVEELADRDQDRKRILRDIRNRLRNACVQEDWEEAVVVVDLLTEVSA